MAVDVPTDEWIEIISDVESGWYTLEVEGDDVDLSLGEKPHQPEAGVKGREGDFLPLDVSSFAGSVYAKAKASQATVRAAAGRVERQARRDTRVQGQKASDGDYTPVSVTAQGTVQTDNYSNGAFYSLPTDVAYGTAIDPSFTVQEFILTKIPNDKTIDITTNTGDTITGFDPNGQTLGINFLEIDSLSVNDPSATGGDTFVLVVGE